MITISIVSKIAKHLKWDVIDIEGVGIVVNTGDKLLAFNNDSTNTESSSYMGGLLQEKLQDIGVTFNYEQCAIHVNDQCFRTHASHDKVVIVFMSYLMLSDIVK